MSSDEPSPEAVESRVFAIGEQMAQATQSSSASTPKSAPFESKQLGEYTTRTEIGRGGFGVVFKAQHGIDEEWYAIKQVAPIDVADTEQSPGTMLREVRFLAKLDHLNIVRYYGAWLEKPPPGEKHPWMDSNQPCLYIKMEWCSGPTLHEWLGKNRLPAQRPISQMLDWFSQLVSAVKYIHNKGLIHRDIKPGNIFFGSSRGDAASVLKIGDLGLATYAAVSPSFGVSESLSIVGTGSYMSPEQLSGYYKNSTDIFSLGLVFLEMVHPFNTDRERCSAFGALRANQRSPVMNKLDKKMDELISWMTTFEPEKRPTASELDNELKKKTTEQLSESAKEIGVRPHAETSNGTDSNVKSEAGTSSLAVIAPVDEGGSPASKRLKLNSLSEARISYSGTSTISSSEHSDIDGPSIDDGILEGINFTKPLPLKLALKIFGYLHEGDLTQCALVSRKFRAVSNHQILWKPLYQEVFEYSLPLLHVGHARFEFRESHDWPQSRSVSSSVPVQTGTTNAGTNDDDESIIVNPWKESFMQLRDAQALQKDGIHVRPGCASLYSGFGAGGRRLTQCNRLDQALQLVKARGKNAEKLIFLHTGLYIPETTVRINSDIQIIGASAGPDIASQVVIEGRFATTVTLARGSQGAYLGWMTVRCAPDFETVAAAIAARNPRARTHNFALQIHGDSTALVEHCVIHSSATIGTAVYVRGRTANPRMRHCVVCDCESTGICVTDAAQGQFEDCEIARNNGPGIGVDNHANPFFRQCHIYDGRGAGISTFSHGMGYFESCNIHNNRISGIEVRDAANPTVTRCEVHHGQAGGVYVHTEGRGQFMENRIHLNAFSGIEITSRSNPKITSNKIWDNQKGGVFIHGNGQGVLEDNEIFDNAVVGVGIETDGNPKLRRNKIYNGRGEGVLISDKGRGVLEDNDIYRNVQAGVLIVSKSNPTLRRNRVYEGRATGIEIRRGAMATLESNAIFHNRFGGLFLATGAKPTLRDNKIYDNDDLVEKTEHSDIDGPSVDDGILEGINFTKLLSLKLMLKIFGHLYEGDLTRCALVSRKFQAVSNHQILWKSLYQEVFEYSLPLLHVGRAQFEFREPHDWPQSRSVSSSVPVQTGTTNAETNDDESIVVNPWKKSFKQLRDAQALQKDGIHVRPGCASLYSGFGAGGRRLTQCNRLDQALRLVEARGKNAEKLIFLHTGFYILETTVTINSDIQIIGASADSDIASRVIIEGRSATTVTLAKGSQGAYLGWMTVRFAPDSGAVAAALAAGNLPMYTYYCALQICDDSTALVEHCVIHPSATDGAAVCVHGSAANPKMRHCAVCNCGSAGIRVTDAAQGQFEDCEIARNNGPGIGVDNHANPFFQRCHIHDGRGPGISTSNHGMGYFESCNIHNNRFAGIEVRGAANPTVTLCEVHHGRQSGVYVRKKGRGQFMENRIYSNTFSGITIESHSNPKIARNKIDGNQDGGVIVTDNGQGVLEDNEIFDNIKAGVRIETDGYPKLRRNKIYDGRGDGVLIFNKGRGVLEDNDIYRNVEDGVLILSESNPTLRRNRVYEGRAAGIAIGRSAMATLESNAIFHNRFGGLFLATGAKPTLRDNKIYDNDDLVEKTIAKGGCLFEISSDTSLTMHDVYHCATCSTTEENGICLNCIRTCHAGHAVHLVCCDSFTCACGAGTLTHQCRLQSEVRDDSALSVGSEPQRP